MPSPKFRNSPLVLVLVAGAVGLGLLMWMEQSQRAVPAEPSPVPAASASASASVAVASAAASRAARYPVDTQQNAVLSEPEVSDMLADLLGSKAVATFLRVDDFPRRLVETVDNLGRASAPAARWPVEPMPAPFLARAGTNGPTTSEDNGARYTPFVLLAETADLGKAVKLYARMYPLLQQAYRDRGHPDGHFNDRLVEVIDLLLATPDTEYPLALQLVDAGSPSSAQTARSVYLFADPALETLTAGQKILLRMGPVNQRRLKSKLVEIRGQLVRTPSAR